jgi:hypothetical protein
MGLFSKKPKNLEEEDKDFEVRGDTKDDNKKVFKKKDLKDLNLGDKKARREPKKPWGKKERFFVFIMLFLTVGISAYLWLYSMGFKFPSFNLSSLKIQNLFKEETIIIENDKAN